MKRNILLNPTVETQGNVTAPVAAIPAIAHTEQALVVLGAIGGDRMVPILNAKGKATGARLAIGTQGSFKAIKDSLRAADPSLKGEKLSKKVNEIFYGEKDARVEVATLLVGRMAAANLYADVVAVRKNTATINFRKPSEQVAKGKKLSNALETLTEAAKAGSMTAEQRKAAIAMLSVAPESDAIEVEATPA